MKLLVLMLLASAPTRPSDGLIPGAEDFDLRRAKRASDCAQGYSGAIVVCGRRAKSDEIVVKNPGQFESGPLRAETRFGGGTLDMHGEQHSFPDGRSGPAAMVRFTLPF